MQNGPPGKEFKRAARSDVRDRSPSTAQAVRRTTPRGNLRVDRTQRMLTVMTTPLGRRLRELRGERDLSLREFALRLGAMSKAHLSDIELGRRNPSPSLLAKMADVLGVELEELQRLDARPPVEEMRRRIESDPALGIAFRQVVEDESVSGEDLLRFLQGERQRGRDQPPED